jgi:aminoglycoside 2'-N-acetyltransferase I
LLKPDRADFHGVTDLRLAHTSDLDASTLAAVRALLDAAFDGDFSDHDWEHALGGMHALAWEGDELVGHASVVQRRLLHAGRALRTGYVEGVGVRRDRQRRGHGAALMAAVERVIRGAYDLGALGSTDAGAALYVARGWRRWEGPTSVLTPDGIVRTEQDDDAIYVLPVRVRLDLDAPLVADWRDGDAW